MSIPGFNSCEELLQAMIGIDSVNANISGRPKAEVPLAEYLEGQAKSLGLATRRLAVAEAGFNLLVSLEADPKAPWLMFESHLDTVSTEGMTVEPLVGRIENDRIYGRGSCDTKGSGAAMLWALAQYAAGTSRPNNIAILYTIDEEIFKSGAASFVANDLPGLGYKPAGVIIGEPTGLRLLTAHCGFVRWTIRTKGVAAHSADPSRGRSAISMMVKVIEAIESRYITDLNAPHPLIDKAVCSINMIQGGVQVNIIPESCQIRLDRRVVPGEDAYEVLPAVEKLLDPLREAEADFEVVQEDASIDLPLDPAGSESLVCFVQQTLATMNMPTDCIGASYTTEASDFSRAGVPAVVIGPGDSLQAHTCDEWLALDQLHQAVEVYLRLMRQPV